MSVVFPLSNNFSVVFPAPPPSYSKALLDTATPGSYTVTLDESLYTLVILVGAGGGGSTGSVTGNTGYAGGGGAAMIAIISPNTTGSLSITVGAGGAGGAASTSQNSGSAGGNTTLGWGGVTYFTCGGGAGGTSSNNGANGSVSVASGAPTLYLLVTMSGNPVFSYVQGKAQAVGAMGASSSSGAGGTGEAGGIGAGGGGGAVSYTHLTLPTIYSV